MLTPATLAAVLAAALAADKKRIANLRYKNAISRHLLDAYRYWAEQVHGDLESVPAELQHYLLSAPLAALAASIKCRKDSVRNVKKTCPDSLMLCLFAIPALDDIHRHLARAIRDQLDTINQETKK